MDARTAKVVSRGIIVACLAMIVVDAVLLTMLERRGAVGTVYVVGDPAAPGMADVRSEIEQRLARGEVSGETARDAIFFGSVGLLWALTGSLIVSRHARNVAGWIFCAIGVSVAVNGLAFGYALYGVKVAGGSLPGLGAAAMLGEYTFASTALIPLMFLLFPDGRPPSARWRWATRSLLVGLVLTVGALALQPGPLNNLVDSGVLYANPYGLAPFAEGEPGSLLIPIGVLIILAASLATVVAVRQRFRRATGEERQQMRWLVTVATAAGAGVVLSLIVGVSGLLVEGVDDIPSPVFEIPWLIAAVAIFLGIPIAYLVAIYRYRLWDLDIVIRKAVVAVMVTSILLAVGMVLIGIAGQAALGGTSRRVGVLLGVLAGFLIWPLYKASRRVAHRVAFGKRLTAYEVLTTLSERLGEMYSIADVLPRITQVLANGTGATTVRVLMQIDGEVREIARWPDEVPTGDDEHAVPVMDHGEELGAIAVTMSPSDPMDPGKEKLIRDLASQTGLVLRNVRLVEELRASRERLVAAQNDERRKIERNIHDGVQQELVALAVRLGLARSVIATDGAKAGSMLGELQSDAQRALDDLRDLARGIYPPLLEEEGLAAALEAQARRSSITVDVQADGVGRYPQDVEAAVYFCTLEALNNVAKHADASSATIRLEQRNGRLYLTVRDDGRGFEPGQGVLGTGLRGMADRLEVIGGALQVDSAPGEGTTIHGVVPIDGTASSS